VLKARLVLILGTNVIHAYTAHYSRWFHMFSHAEKEIPFLLLELPPLFCSNALSFRPNTHYTFGANLCIISTTRSWWVRQKRFRRQVHKKITSWAPGVMHSWFTF